MIIIIKCESIYYVQQDLILLEAIIFNLISNAIKYSNKKGEIILSCSKESFGRIMISVIDQGPGILPRRTKKYIR